MSESAEKLLAIDSEMGKCVVVDEREGKLYVRVQDRAVTYTWSRMLFYLQDSGQVDKYTEWEENQQRHEKAKQ